MLNEALKLIKLAYEDGRTFLLEHEAKSLCMLYNIPTTLFKVAQDVDEALQAAREIGYPVVIKIISRDIIHKSDVGGVIVNIRSDEEAINACKIIENNVLRHNPNAKIDGFLVEKMAQPTTEVIVGMIKDPQFGPAIMFGLGGIFVEVLKDVSFRVVPLTRYDAEEMIKEIKAYPILKGIRGRPPADIEALINIILNVSKMSSEISEINQIDLNPIFTYPKGAITVDARIILEKRQL
ncbi:MAG: acetate--CoA ligase family protein [Candidatus Methanomethylicia archaeon]